MTLPGFPDAMPFEGFVGGLLIGLAAAIMLLGSYEQGMLCCAFF